MTKSIRIKDAGRLLAGTALTASIAMATPALAQDADVSYGVNEIIVTAQKREESIQDVPIAVSALGEEMITSNRISKTTDLTGLAPGLIARVNPGGNASPSFSMRGVSASASVPTQDRQIPIYLDGVYVGGNRGSISDVVDLERIEVLRGPQGTLFGRNATAGAVHFITRNPTGEMGFRQDLTVGNYNQLRSRTTIDTPSFGPFSAYMTYVHDERRGDVRNLGAGTSFDRRNPFNGVGASKSPKWLGGRNSESFSAALRYDNGGALTASYKFSWFTGTGSEARPVVVINPNNFTGSFLLAALATQPAGGGKYGEVVIASNNKRPKATNNAWSQPTSQEVTGHNFTLEYQASDSLTIKNIFAYRQSKSFGPVTIDGVDGIEYNDALKALYTAPLAFLGGASYAQVLGGNNGDFPVGTYFATYGGNSRGEFWQVSDELQVNYTADNLDVTAGAMYYYSKANDGALDGFTNNFFARPVPTIVPIADPRIYDDDGTTKSIAAYLQAEYQVTHNLGLVAGARITKENKWSRLTTGATFVGDRSTGELTDLVVAGEGRFKKTKPSFSVGVNFEPNNDILLYAKYSTAFLSGGATGDVFFDPETAKSWEAGIKSDWFDGRLRFNLTGYFVEYKNAQAALSGRAVNRPDLGVAVLPLGDVEVKGLELDLVVAPAEGFTLGGTLGYTNDKLKNGNPVVTQGRPYKRTTTPAWVGSGYAQYVTQPLFGDATMQFRLDATYQSRMRAFGFTDLAENPTSAVFAPYEFIPSKVIVNGRVALRDIDMGGANVELGVWGKNILNNKDGLYPFDFGQILYSGNFEQAPTYGLDVIIKFNP